MCWVISIVIYSVFEDALRTVDEMIGHSERRVNKKRMYFSPNLKVTGISIMAAEKLCILLLQKYLDVV